jgi:hypothetical protein
MSTCRVVLKRQIDIYKYMYIEYTCTSYILHTRISYTKYMDVRYTGGIIYMYICYERISFISVYEHARQYINVYLCLLHGLYS